MILTIVLAIVAGVGAGAAWGYRTALHVALGRMALAPSRVALPRPEVVENRRP